MNGKFHVVCTLYGWDDVKKSRFYAGHFLVSAGDPSGAWSSPKWIKGGGGIDPSLFQDTDGKVYLLSNSAPGKRHVKDQNRIGVWEFDQERACVLDKGTPLVYGLHTRSRWTEAPHLYRMKNGQYLLLVAEGGTGPSAEKCRQLGGAWPWGFLDGVYYIGAGIGEYDEAAVLTGGFAAGE